MFVSMLVSHIPMLLVYLLGMFFALAFWRRCPVPCALTLGATGLLFVVSVGHSLLFSYLMNPEGGSTIAQSSRTSMIGVIGLCTTILHALGFCLLLAAVFHGRRRSEGQGTD
jgi:hypothetical protein